MIPRHTNPNLPPNPVPNCPTITFYAGLEHTAFHGLLSRYNASRHFNEMADDPRLDVAADVGRRRALLHSFAESEARLAGAYAEVIDRLRTRAEHHTAIHETYYGCEPVGRVHTQFRRTLGAIGLRRTY